MAQDGRSKNEGIKEASEYLRGSLVEELADSSDAFSGDAAQLLKFHGVYQQDDRDVRRERGKQGLGKDWSCMVRAAVPGGRLDAEQYLVMDRLADEVANGSLRVTTRQGIQYHFTRKGDLPQLIGTLNEHLVTTLAACGDVSRNVMSCSAPLADQPAGEELHAVAAELARHLKPQTEAYWQLWVDGERVSEAAAPPDADESDPEPLYGPTYLPRKFKIALAAPGDNCVDVFTQDIGLAAHVDDRGRLDGFTVLVGGGLGMTHKNPATYPRLADPLGFVTPDELVEVATTIVGVQRDHGDRANRKHARMKYLIDDWGLDAFRVEVERRLGRTLAPPRLLTWERTEDHLGWHEQADGRWFLGVRVQSGRILDDDTCQLRTALRRIVERFRPGLQLTPRQDVLLTDVATEDRAALADELVQHGVPPVEAVPPVARHALACPAVPTCGLAIAEAERVLPRVIDSVHAELQALGLERDAIHLRVAGCPNGCSRPYSSEVGVVGRGVDRYTIFVGGSAEGTRLAEPYADHVGAADVGEVLRPALVAYRDRRDAGEAFGDFCARVGVGELAVREDSAA